MSGETDFPLSVAMCNVRLVPSRSVARRMIASGQVTVDGVEVRDMAAKLSLGSHWVRVGKRATRIVVDIPHTDPPEECPACLAWNGDCHAMDDAQPPDGYTACGAMAPAEERNRR